jgi:hypothetical protein
MDKDGVKVRVMGTDDLPTTRSDGAIVKEIDDTRLSILPDETSFETEHEVALNLTPTEPIVGGPIVKPLMVIVTADALITAPEVVITTAVADAALHVAFKPATLLAPEATEGTEEDAKKLAGYDKVKELPKGIRQEGEKATVTETDEVPDTRSEAAMLNVDNVILPQSRISHRDIADKAATATGPLLRLVVVPSPT